MKGYLRFYVPLIIGTLFLSSCNMDKDAPVITILGDNPMTIELNESFVDPGATAMDDTDGDLTAAIIVDGEVNPNLKGTYELEYSVTDEADNTRKEIRKVYVVNSVDFLEGSWNVTDNKIPQSGSPIQGTYLETITPCDSVNGRFWVTMFGNHINGFVHIDQVLDSQFEVQQQEVNCGTPAKSRRFLGTATVIDNDNITVNYTEIVGSESFSGSGTYVRR